MSASIEALSLVVQSSLGVLNFKQFILHNENLTLNDTENNVVAELLRAQHSLKSVTYVSINVLDQRKMRVHSHITQAW